MARVDEAEFSRVMQRLRDKYALSLSDKADELADAFARYSEASDAGAGDGVAQIIHRLAGTAGSFEVHDVSALAGGLEAQLHRGQRIEALAEDIERLIELMRSHARSATSS